MFRVSFGIEYTILNIYIALLFLLQLHFSLLYLFTSLLRCSWFFFCTQVWNVWNDVKRMTEILCGWWTFVFILVVFSSWQHCCFCSFHFLQLWYVVVPTSYCFSIGMSHYIVLSSVKKQCGCSISCTSHVKWKRRAVRMWFLFLFFFFFIFAAIFCSILKMHVAYSIALKYLQLCLFCYVL